MKILIYYEVTEYSLVDWRILAMQELEPKIVYTACDCKIPKYTSEDLAQELRLEIWRNLPKFDNSRSSLKTWARMVMLSHLNHLDIKITKTKKRKDYLAEPLHELNI